MLGRIFQDVDMYARLVPNERERAEVLPRLFSVVVRYGVLFGEVYATSPALEGLAVWLPSNKATMSLPRVVRSGGLGILATVGMGILRRFEALGGQLQRRHRHLMPRSHWYLSVVGVDPELQGKGYGGSLLRAKLSHLDEEQLPCYLETYNEQNVAIFRRYGFRILEKFTVEPLGIEQWAMAREAGES